MSVMMMKEIEMMIQRVAFLFSENCIHFILRYKYSKKERSRSNCL